MVARVIVNPINRSPQANGGDVDGKAMRRFFSERATRRPKFSGCWASIVLPNEIEVVEEYTVNQARIRIALSPGGGENYYHVIPWEYTISDEWLHAVTSIIEEIPFLPPPSISVTGDELRDYVKEVAARKLRSIPASTAMNFGDSIDEKEKNIARLSEIVVRYTVGLGLFETLLSDDRLEDIYVDAPSWKNPVHVTMNGLAGKNNIFRCTTNITISDEEARKLTSRLRQISGRPFSQAFPVMETDLGVFDSRATVIGPPLSPEGTALALRRHSKNPWTLLKLVSNGTLDVKTAGLLSFLVDGRSTVLICGARGAGKSSLLSALMFEFPLSQRILTIEDTLELPTRQMQTMGYKVQSLFVEPRLESNTEEVAEQALRVSLRLGESAIVLGEVRGKEARTLYESMRTGKAGSSVLGTIHGESASSVYERVVHDMGIPREAFMATDIVLTMGLRRPGGSSTATRKLVEVAECRKIGETLGFTQLLEIGDTSPAPLLIRPELSSVVERIASSWDMGEKEATDNILARGELRSVLLKAASFDPSFIGAPWVLKCNEFFRSRLDAGDHDYQRMVADFRTQVESRCGHELI
jgi:type IV secretory pathway ATPase VirB11/archaellum biosynthesis ATPase